MKRAIIYISVIVTSLFFTNAIVPAKKKATQTPAQKTVQIAILLDVSGSMDGLINQAKAQLWNMVNLLGRSKCDGQIPKIEIALYEYGRSNNDASKGYVKKINGFINNLDSLSANLFSLTTNGGDEYCGQVIYTSLEELQWNTQPDIYKTIFIAGNEDFLQGNVKYETACLKAKEKGVIVNTIYCGDKMTGIKEHWDITTTCGSGSFTNINQNAKDDEPTTPFDSTLIALNNKLNTTYISYGYDGNRSMENQALQDVVVTGLSKKASIQRTSAKANSSVYDNKRWDAVDAFKDDKNFVKKIDKEFLADSLKTKTTAELTIIIEEKQRQRAAIQNEIKNNTAKREIFINDFRKQNTKSGEQTLETEMEKIIIQQTSKFNIKFDN